LEIIMLKIGHQLSNKNNMKNKDWFNKVFLKHMSMRK
jgi:hypothetical protein